MPVVPLQRICLPLPVGDDRLLDHLPSPNLADILPATLLHHRLARGLDFVPVLGSLQEGPDASRNDAPLGL